MKKPIPAKIMAAIAVAVGVTVLVIEILRTRSGASIEIWLWGTVALLAVVFGLYELLAAKDS